MKINVILLLAANLSVSVALAQSEERVMGQVPVARAWSGHPVGFSLLTRGRQQFVAYYDPKRNMTVASRRVDETNWTFKVLSERVGWDSHNSVTMALDADKQLHVSGNMHVVPLVYFRTTRPLDVASLERAPMLDDREKRVTYPRFLTGPSNELIFTYRDGSSGNGDQIVNSYDLVRKKWSRLLDTPLFSGGGQMNAYFVGPVLGPDGFFHIVWVWRDHPGCESNHDVCYARSRDLVHWETSTGRPMKLPITLEEADIVDPVPAGGGIINGNTQLGFDPQGRVVVSYHKNDTNGFLQIYNACREAAGWRIQQATNWRFRWKFSGGGTINFEAGLSGVSVVDGQLEQSWWNNQDGHARWMLDPKTLRPICPVEAPGLSYAEVDHRWGPLPEGLKYRGAEDLGKSDEPGVRYVLRWASREANRDLPYGDVPPPQMLRVIKIGATSAH